jgi:hypothetical protein
MRALPNVVELIPSRALPFPVRIGVITTTLPFCIP